MSTEIKTKAKKLRLTEFAGGKNGLMISVFQDNFFANEFKDDDITHLFFAKNFSNIHLTKEQALQLGKDLIKWSKK